jgi:hypothetical protein
MKRAATRRVPALAAVNSIRDYERGQHGLVRFRAEQDVSRLDVAVDDTALVYGQQRLGHIGDVPRRRGPGQLAGLLQQRGEGAAWDVFQDKVRLAIFFEPDVY